MEDETRLHGEFSRSSQHRDESPRKDMLVQALGWGFPVQRFAWTLIELAGNPFEFGRGMDREVRAFGEVLTQEPIGVLVRAALPRTGWVTEIHGDVGDNAEGAVLGHLRSLILIPGQRSPQLLGQRPNQGHQRIPDLLGGVAARQVPEQDVAGSALDQRQDG